MTQEEFNEWIKPYFQDPEDFALNRNEDGSCICGGEFGYHCTSGWFTILKCKKCGVEGIG